MLQLNNETPFQAERCVKIDKDGNQIWVVIVKATFRIDGAPHLNLHADQEPVCRSPVYAGEPGQSSLLRDAEMVHEHPGTCVTLGATAYAPEGRAVPVVDAGVEVGSLRRTLRVFGDRHWRRAGDGLVSTAPEPFESLPICYERAYGGMNVLNDQTGQQESEPRNPIGRGFASSVDLLAGKPLPNIEDPAALVETWRSRPAPAGFGPIPAHWSPRKEYAGTFDADWQRSRAPLWPQDYDSRHQLSAPSELASPGPLRGDEQVRLTNLTPEGTLAFRLPRVYLTVRTTTLARRFRQRVQMDRVIIEPDNRKLVLVWRSSLNCRADARQVLRTTVGTKPFLR